MKALIVDKNIPGGQGRGSIMGLPRPLFLKSSIYHKEWAWQANKNATSPIFRIQKAHTVKRIVLATKSLVKISQSNSEDLLFS